MASHGGLERTRELGLAEFEPDQVAVVANAVWGMARTLAPDRERATLAVAAAVTMLIAARAEVQIAFTGYVHPGSPAEGLVASGRARAVRWKIHPSLSENAALVRAIGARTVVPCFGGNPATLPAWQASFAPAEVTLEIGRAHV